MLLPGQGGRRLQWKPQGSLLPGCPPFRIRGGLAPPLPVVMELWVEMTCVTSKLKHLIAGAKLSNALSSAWRLGKVGCVRSVATPGVDPLGA